MQSDPIPNGPVFDGAYVPYFYQSGLFLINGVPSGRRSAVSSAQAYARYDFSGDPQPWLPPRQPQTVEQIIAHGYFAIPGGEPETAIITDKKQTSRLGLDDVIQQVRQRYQIYENNIHEIELGKCYAISSVLAVQAERGGVRSDSRESYSLCKSLRELYEAQRDERVRLWQDVSRLRQTLPETAQNYLSAYRKIAILEDSMGDAP